MSDPSFGARANRALVGVRPIRCVAGALVALMLMFPVFVFGALSGGFLGVDGADETCSPARPLLDPEVTRWVDSKQSLVPLSNECFWDDGVSAELVPVWINPALALVFVGAGALIVLAVRAAWVRRGAR